MASGFIPTANGSTYPSKPNQIAQPAVGSDWSFIMLNMGLVVAVEAVLTTSATAGARVPRLRIIAPGNVFVCDSPQLSAINPSSTARCVWFAGAAGTGLGGEDLAPLPFGLVVTPGWSVAMSTANIDNAGDQWSQIVVTTSA